MYKRQIEDQIATDNPSRIRETLAAQMAANPGYWQDYYSGSEEELRRLRTFSYSDRIRYYWTDPKVSASLQHLIDNLSKTVLPETIVSQAFTGLSFGEMPTDPNELMSRHVQRCVDRYFEAAGHRLNSVST